MSERVCAPEHGLSQLVTSFVASESQGILHVPFSPFHFILKSGLFCYTGSVCDLPVPFAWLNYTCFQVARSFLILFLICSFELKSL